MSELVKKNDYGEEHFCLEAVCECGFSLSAASRIQRVFESMDALTATNRRQEEEKESEKCSICLLPFDKQTAASLESCQHEFCLECILQWSQTANTCPVDRISFDVIQQRRCPGGDIQKQINVSVACREEGDDDEEEASSPLTCEECGRTDRGHQLLVCTQCDSGYHMDCLPSSLTTDPEDDWVCPECADVPPNRENSMVAEGEISDGELTDLLAEGDDAAFVSSRLRPSTLNRQHGVAERRHSRRIQSRTRTRTSGVIPNSLRHTSGHVPKYLLTPRHSSASCVSGDTRSATTRRERAASSLSS